MWIAKMGHQALRDEPTTSFVTNQDVRCHWPLLFSPPFVLLTERTCHVNKQKVNALT